jgi:hypothetical protein
MPSYVLLVDSRKRNLTAYPDPNHYAVDFEETFRNVESVELVHAVYEKFGTENVICLFIDEIGNRMISNCHAVTDSFTQLPLVNYINEYSGGYAHYRSIKSFPTPLEKLARLVIRFTDLDGVPYKMLDHQMRFVVRTSERNTAVDSGYIERLVEPLRPGAALLGLGNAYTEADLRNAYVNKWQLFMAEQRSSAEIEQLAYIYRDLLKRGFGKSA